MATTAAAKFGRHARAFRARPYFAAAFFRCALIGCYTTVCSLALPKSPFVYFIVFQYGRIIFFVMI